MTTDTLPPADALAAPVADPPAATVAPPPPGGEPRRRGWRWWRRPAPGTAVPDRDLLFLEVWWFLLRERRHAQRRHVALGVLLVILLATPALFLADGGNLAAWWAPRGAGILATVEVAGVVGERSGVEPERVIKGLRRAYAATPRAVVLRINSPGGAPYVAERITTELEALKAAHPDLPLYAVIEEVGASAAYLIALHADTIIAGRYSTVGSIGAVLSSWDLHRLAARVDIGKHIFTSGRLKAMLDPFRPLEEVEAAKAQAIVDSVAALFAQEVQAQRGAQPLDMTALTTGEVWVGEQAVALGLVDRLGTLESLSQELGVTVVDFTVEPNPLTGGLTAATHRVMETVRAAMAQPVWQ